MIAHDFGSVIGSKLCLDYPHLVDRVVRINGPSLHGLAKNWRQSWDQIRASYYMFFYQLPFLPEISWRANNWATYRLLVASLGTPLEDVEKTLEEFGAKSDPTVIHYAINWYRGLVKRIFRLVFDPEKNVEIPHDTLMLWGENDPALKPHTPEIESTFITGKVQIKRYPKASHNLHQQEKENVLGEIRKFIFGENFLRRAGS